MIHQRYILAERLGEGGFGSVYRAHDHQLHRDVALKIAHPPGQDTLAEQRQSFMAEARLLSQLHNPGICSIYDYFELSGGLYIIMELVVGQSLEDYVANQTQGLSEPELRRLMVESLAILGYLHSQSPPIVHRDFKPANLLRSDEGSFKLVDFGISRQRTRGQRDTQVIGTEGYASPEQCAGLSEPATDLYAWGATMFFAATRQHPLSSWPPYPSLAGMRPDLPQELAQILEVCKEHDPAKRPSARDILKWLKHGGPEIASAPAPVLAGCPFCNSQSAPTFLDCCPDCLLSRGLQGLSSLEWAARGEELYRQGVVLHAASHLSQALKLSPNASTWRLPLARALARSGRPNEALGWLRQCPPGDEVTMETAFVQCMIPAERARVDETLKGSRGPLSRAFGLYLAKDRQELDALARQYPHLAPICVLATRLHTIQGDTPGALLCINEGLGSNPSEASLLRQKMQLTWETNQPAECRLATMALRRLAPWDPLTALFVGRFLAGEGNIGRAVEEFRRYLEFCPRELKTHLELAEILCTRGGRNDEAIALLEPLLGDPQVGRQATDKLIRVLQIAGNHIRAVQLLERTVTDTSDTESMGQLALSLHRIGRSTEALSWAQKALARDPGCQLAQLVLTGQVSESTAAPPTRPMAAPPSLASPTTVQLPPPPAAPIVTAKLPSSNTTPVTKRMESSATPSFETRAMGKEPPLWAKSFKDESVRRVFLHLANFGSITEPELAAILGGSREVRKFSNRLSDYLERVPFEVVIETGPSGKRYVRSQAN